MRRYIVAVALAIGVTFLVSGILAAVSKQREWEEERAPAVARRLEAPLRAAVQQLKQGEDPADVEEAFRCEYAADLHVTRLSTIASPYPADSSSPPLPDEGPIEGPQGLGPPPGDFRAHARRPHHSPRMRRDGARMRRRGMRRWGMKGMGMRGMGMRGARGTKRASLGELLAPERKTPVPGEVLVEGSPHDRHAIFQEDGFLLDLDLSPKLRGVGHGSHSRRHAPPHSPEAQALRAGIGSAIVLVFLFLMLAPVGRDLVRLEVAAKRLRAGDLNARVGSLGRFSPVAGLARAFDDMAASVARQTAASEELQLAVAHELRTPAAKIALAAELADAEGSVGEEARASLASSAQEIGDLTQELLEFHRGALIDPDNGETTDLTELLVEMGDDWPDVGFSQEYAPRVVRGSTQPLKRAIGNLVSNAQRYAETVHVSVKEGSPTTLEVLVDDDGPGIPEEARVRLFQPFERLHESRNRGQGGRGLGLAIVMRTAQALGGGCRIEDSPLGGARFVIWLPSV